MIKIQIAIPKQSFVVEGKDASDAIENIDWSELDWGYEILNSDDSTKSDEPTKLYVCPNEDCEYQTHWSFEDIKDKGEPVCPNCDEDLVQACEDCEYPEDECHCNESCIKCGKSGSFPDSICNTCAEERGL